MANFGENVSENTLEKFVVHEKVQDRAIEDKMSNVVRVKDPCTGNTLVSIRNPQVKIKPYSSMDGVVDMEEHITNRRIPIFYKTELPLDFSNERTGWHNMLNLIKSKDR